MAFVGQSRSNYYPSSEDQEFPRHSTQIIYLDQQTLQVEQIQDDQSNDTFYNVSHDYLSFKIDSYI